MSGEGGGEAEQSNELNGMEKAVKSPSQPMVVFTGYRDQVLDATRESFKILRRLHVSSARSLAKLVRAERGVTPDEWAQQRAFLIKEHIKQIDSIQDEAQVRVQEEKHKTEWSMKQERVEMQARMEAELGAVRQQAEEERASLQRKIEEVCDARVKDVEQKLEVAMQRLAEGDFDLLKNLTLANEFIEQLKEQKESLNQTIEDMKEQESEHVKEIKRLKKDRQILNSSLEEAKKQARRADQERNRAERREHKLNEDLEITRKEYHYLEKKLLEETHELESLRKLCAKLTKNLEEAEAKLPQIEILNKKLAASERKAEEADRLKEQMVRKCWVLENEVTQLQKDHSLLISELDELRAETAKQREGLVMSELAMKGVHGEVQRQVALAKHNQALQEARHILTQRARQLREEAKMPLHLIPKASLSFSTDSTDSEDTIRSRLLFRAAALELEATRIIGIDERPAAALLAEAQIAVDNAVCGEEDGAELPLRVIPYDFESSGKTRRNVRQIVDEIYSVDNSQARGKSSGTSQASVSGGAHTDVSGREPIRVFSAQVGSSEPRKCNSRHHRPLRHIFSACYSCCAATSLASTTWLRMRAVVRVTYAKWSCILQPGGEQVAKPDFTIGSKESIDLHGGVPVHVASGKRPQSALSATRRRPPEPMSLGVKKNSTGNRGPTGVSRRPASALGRFSSDFSADSRPGGGKGSLGGSIDEMHAGGDLFTAGARGLEKSDTLRSGKLVKGRPSSALAQTSERKRKEEDDNCAEESQDVLQTLDGNSKASIYMLMRRTSDSISRAREHAVSRFLERAHHDTVALPRKDHSSSRKSSEVWILVNPHSVHV